MIIKALKSFLKHNKSLSPVKSIVEQQAQGTSARPLPTIRLDEKGQMRKCDVCGALLDSDNYKGEYGIDPNVMREIVAYVIKHTKNEEAESLLPDLAGLSDHNALSTTRPYVTCKKCLKLLEEIYFRSELSVDKSIIQ